MNKNIQGPQIDIEIATSVIIIKRRLLEREDAGSPAVQECVHCLDDFLWNFAGLATWDGPEDICETFLNICEYNSRQ